MAFSFFGILKGLIVENEVDRTKQVILQSSSASITNTSTTITTAQTANRIITLPDASDTLTSNNSTQTLSHKTLDNTTIETIKDSNLTIQNSSDITKQAQLNLSGLTTSTTRTYTLPDANTTIVGTTVSQTLSNKTLDNTTIETIKDSNLTLENSSDITKQAKLNLSNISTNTTRTFSLPDVNDSLVARSSIDTLTTKTIGDSLTFNQISTPSNPAPGFDKLYVKSDNNFYTLNSSGIENPLSGSSGANVNLSNLSSPTSINQDLIPSNTTKSLGSSTKPWLSASIDGLYDFTGIFRSVSPNARTLTDATNHVSTNWTGNFTNPTQSNEGPSFQQINIGTVSNDGSAGYIRLSKGAGTNIVTWVFPTSNGSSGQKLQTDGLGNLSWISSFPTQQVFTSGSGTYTTPTGAKAIKIRMIGGGGGGGGTGASSTSDGTAGGDTTFSTYTASGGGFGTNGTGSFPTGIGGDAVANSGSPAISMLGASGQHSYAYNNPNTSTTTTIYNGGPGGNGAFGGGGKAGRANGAGGNGAVNTGGGGGGASITSAFGGGGGASGSYVEQLISSPSATYSYSVGSGGAHGIGSSQTGGAGGGGIIIVDEYY